MTYVFKTFDNQEIDVPSEDYELAVKMDSFCAQHNKVKIHYPAFFYKAKCGAYFDRICVEPKLGLPKTEQNYSNYRGIYFDFNYEDKNITMFIDGTETLYFNKDNVKYLQQDIKEASEHFFCHNYMIDMIEEEYANVSSIPYVLSRFSEEHLELSLFLFYQMNKEEKNIIFDFFKLFE